MSEADNPRVSLAIAGGVATITLTRAERRNAIDAPMHQALRAAFDIIDQEDQLRAVVLTGSDAAFSAGQDLHERAASFARGERPDLAASLNDNYAPLIRRLAQSPLPVIAAVNGIAFGAGAALAIACDIVLAGESARFQFGFINVGLGPDSGASWALPRLVGQARALDLALTGRAVGADEALSMGLVSRVVPDDELADTAQAIAREFVTRSPAALAAIKRLVRAGQSASLDEALDAECESQSALGRTDDYRDAVLRFTRPRAATTE